ncbi:MAG: endonuclease/exonuclease/phosphatase family protein [Planctomycetaceae bacterium]|nr:endonuclease/exonuclease/phosphatase family protein [Planctomycetaceae bacterium]
MISGILFLAAAILGLALRATVRDRIPIVATACYALPLPVIVAFAAASTGLLLRRRNAGRVAGVVFAAAALWFGMTHFGWNAPAGTTSAVRVAFWNVSRGVRGWKEIVRELRETDADLIGMVEAGPRDTMQEYWRTQFPEHRTEALRGGMALFVKGEILADERRVLATGGEANRVVVRCRGSEWVVWIVDIVSDPLKPRGPTLAALAEAVKPDLGRPLLIMGDFNTPADSTWLDSFRSEMRLQHAFETAGTGYAATWPMPCPVLTLDQVWADRSVEVLQCRHEWSTRSDHRRVLLQVRQK